MNTKIMEGMVGADTNINLVNTPMKVYREAKRKGDTATMERSLGYAGEFAGTAEEYQEKTRRGMEEEAKELKEKKKQDQEEAVEQRKLERQKEREKLAGEKQDGQKNAGDIENTPDIKAKEKAAESEPVIYTNTGKKQAVEPDTLVSVLV